MAHIEDRWERVVQGSRVRTDRYGKGDRWRARYLDPAGRERSQTFGRKTDAERFLATVETDKLRGAYLDPQAGRVTLGDFYAEWSARRLWENNTRTAMSWHCAAASSMRFPWPSCAAPTSWRGSSAWMPTASPRARSRPA